MRHWHVDLMGPQYVRMATSYRPGTVLRLGEAASPGRMAHARIVVVDSGYSWVDWRHLGGQGVHRSDADEWRRLTLGAEEARWR